MLGQYNNPKIPQTVPAHTNRKISVPLEQQQQNVYYVKGNHETESVNKLTEFQEPSIENSSVFNHKPQWPYESDMINDLLKDEDEEHSEILSQPHNLQNQIHSYENKEFFYPNQPQYVYVRRGANSLDRQPNQRQEELQIRDP